MSCSSTRIYGSTLFGGAFAFGEKRNRIVLDFRAKGFAKPDGWESCGSDAGNESNVGDEWKLVSDLKSDSEEVTALWERDLKEPRNSDFWGVEGTGDVPSSYTILLDWVAYEELVVVEDILGREELPGESRVHERAPPSERDEKCPSTLGRHRHDEELAAAHGSSDRGSCTGCDV